MTDTKQERVYHKPITCTACGCTQDLPDALQCCHCKCHPANWPVGAVQELISAIAEHRRWYDTCTRTAASDWEEQAANASERLDTALANLGVHNA